MGKQAQRRGRTLRKLGMRSKQTVMQTHHPRLLKKQMVTRSLTIVLMSHLLLQVRREKKRQHLVRLQMVTQSRLQLTQLRRILHPLARRPTVIAAAHRQRLITLRRQEKIRLMAQLLMDSQSSQTFNCFPSWRAIFAGLGLRFHASATMYSWDQLLPSSVLT